MVRAFRSLLLCAALFAVVPPARAAEWPVARGQSREPDPYRYDAAAWKKVPPDFLDDAPACALYAATTHLVDADGTVETIVHDVTRLGSRKSIEKLGEYRHVSYDPAFQKLTLNVARVHKRGGRAVDVGPRHVHLRDVGTDYLVYNPEKQLVISFPSLEVGDVIEVKWTVRGKNPEHGGHLFTRYTFGADDHPIVLDELRVRLPAGRALRHATINGTIEPDVCEHDGFRFYRWSARHCRLPPADEDAPPKDELRVGVACSTFATWDDVAAWKRRLRADCWECTSEVRKVVKEATAGLSDPVAKARALTYWVRRNVRYVSAGVRHDYTPHRPADVLANRHGDCKDTSQLLAVMLREAGVPAALATLGVRGDGQVLEEVSSPWGTHGILLVSVDGKDHWVDTTATLAAWDFLAKPCRDRLCYVLDDRGIRLKRTPPLTADEHRFEQTTEVVIAADGSSRWQQAAVFHGLAGQNQRDRWLEVPAGEQRRLTASRLQDSNSQARLVRLDIDEAALRDFDRPVRAGVTSAVAGQFAGKDRDGSFTDSRVWNFLLGYNLDYDRKVPLEMYAPVDTRHRFVVRAPAGFEFDGTPKARVVRSKWGEFRREAKWVGADYRTVQIDFHLRLERARVEPADFAAFRVFHRDVFDAYRGWLALEAVSHLRHAPELEVLLHAVPADAAAAAVLARIYLAHERREDARRVLERARRYRPDDLTLWEMAVRAARDRAEAERLQRELVERFPGDPSQAIALGGMLIDRGKYALADPLLEALAKSSHKTPPAARALASYPLARGRFRQGRAEQALANLDDAARYDGNKEHTVAVEMLRGQVCERLGRHADAAGAYEKAHRADPKAEDVLVALVELSVARKDAAEGAGYLRRYLVLVEERFEGLVRAADLALRLGRHDEAFALASRARGQRFHEGVQRVLGLVHFERGEHGKAVFHLERAEPTPAVLEGLIRAQLELGNLRGAEREATRAGLIPTPPDGLKAAKERVRSLRERRDAMLGKLAPPAAQKVRWITAIDHLLCAEEARGAGRPAAQVEALLAKADGEGVALGPVHGLRALLELERGRLRQAMAEAERAVALSPWDARGWYARGRVRLERIALGAVADLEKAAELSARKDAAVLQVLAEAQYLAGQLDRAKQTLREAIKLRPGDKILAEQFHAWENTTGGRP